MYKIQGIPPLDRVPQKERESTTRFISFWDLALLLIVQSGEVEKSHIICCLDEM